MTYLARGNLALALSLTMLATFISPFATPLIMHLCAGQLIQVDTVGMMIGILNMVMVPVCAGLICNKILYASWPGSRGGQPARLAALCFLAGLALIFVPFPVPSRPSNPAWCWCSGPWPPSPSPR